MDHVTVVVDDLPAAIAFFTTLGMALEGEMPVEGPWVDRLCGLEGVQVDITMMGPPDGHGQVELTKFRNPELVAAEPAIAPPNTLGLRQIIFAGEDPDDPLARPRARGRGARAFPRPTRWASGRSCSRSKPSTTPWPACAPTASSSSARWSS